MHSFDGPKKCIYLWVNWTLHIRAYTAQTNSYCTFALRLHVTVIHKVYDSLSVSLAVALPNKFTTYLLDIKLVKVNVREASRCVRASCIFHSTAIDLFVCAYLYILVVVRSQKSVYCTV